MRALTRKNMQAFVLLATAGQSLPWPLQAVPEAIPPQVFSILDFANGTCAGDNATNCTAAVQGAPVARTEGSDWQEVAENARH